MASSSFQFRLNGEVVEVADVDTNESLLSWLRRSGFTGSKEGCAEGDCGACSVVVVDRDLDGEPCYRAINSCLAPMPSLAGREVLTVEGIADEDGLHPVQEAMVACHGSQCGFCTPGFVASMFEAYHREELDREGIADQLCGNLCRCTGYRPIREAAGVCLSREKVTVTANPVERVTSYETGEQRFHFPESLAELFARRAQDPQAVLVAGATEIGVEINKMGKRYPALISTERVAELIGIEETSEAWMIGAGASLTDVREAIGVEYPAMDRMLRLFASRQIRSRATLGGNLATASPIGDSAPVLMVLDAELVLASPQGERTVAVAEFFAGYRQTVLAEDEVLKTVVLPRGLPGRCEFYKVSKRREMDISIISAAFRMELDPDGKVADLRVAFGGVSATTVRARGFEERQIGARPGEVDGIADGIAPISDGRACKEYRHGLISGLWEKFLSGDDEEDEAYADARPSEGPGHESSIGHVNGAAQYVMDTAMRRPMLDVWPIVSEHARAKILHVDTSAVPDAYRVLLAADVPGINNVGPTIPDEPLFAEDEVFYEGQLIGVVIGESLAGCRDVARSVVVEYEVKAPLLGLQAAVAAESFLTEPHLIRRGDVSADCAHQIEGEFEIGGQDHFYLETQAAWAECGDEGDVFVSSSTQHPTEIQTIVAEVLGESKNRVVVESPRMGGGFGGKETQGNAWGAVCALGAKLTGRAVRVQLDRDMDMRITGKRHPFLAKYRAGFDSDGMIQVLEVELYSDGGWSLDLSQPVNDRGLFHLDNAYYIPNVSVMGRVCRTNVCSHTAFRGFGGPQGMVVIEEIFGRVALQMGVPAEELRRKNFYRGSGATNTTHYGEEIDDNRLAKVWDGLLANQDIGTRRAAVGEWNAAHPNRKRGLAITPVKFGISFTLKQMNQAGALVLIYTDGTVQVNHGGTEMGQGLHTKMRAVAARELGVPVDSVRLMHTRTDKVPNTSPTAASAGADLNGMAVADACRKLKGRLGQVEGGEGMSFAQLAKAAQLQRISLAATGFYKTPGLEWDWEVGQGRPFHYFAFGAALSEVEVDGFTGMSVLRRVDILHDVGDSLNPGVDRGQIEGGFVQGMGWLISEDLNWSEDGRLLTHSASTYQIPAFSDAPVEFHVDLLPDAAQGNTIHGSKAVGEPPLMLAISVREAIRDAVAAFAGDGDFELASPCSGEAVFAALRSR